MMWLRMSTLPSGSDLPFIGSFAQPFDDVDFLWVSAQQDSQPKLPSGLTAEEVKLINGCLPAGSQPLRYQAVDTTATDPVVLKSGLHFVVGMGGKIILDYVHTFKKSGSKQDMALVAQENTTPASNKVPLKKKIGPLSITAFGLDFSNNMLTVMLDATINMGPLELQLKGFGILFSLKDTNLKSLSNVKPTLSLNGAAISMNAPPLAVAGFLEKVRSDQAASHAHQIQPQSDIAASDDVDLQGGASLKLKVYSFIAIGRYANTSNFTSVFVYAQANGPFMNIGQDGEYWVLAGVDALICQTVGLTAAVLVSIGPSVILNIFGCATMQMPRLVSEKDCYLRVQLGFNATIDFAGGTFSLVSALAPNSFILNSSCQLSGGFAMCVWWDPSEHAGDWVFSAGGYHPSYIPPTWYPVPDRIQVSWNVSSIISITGQAYFAITPQAAMAGCSIHAALQDGRLSASLDAYANFFINYKPFYFTGALGVAIDIYFQLQVFWWTKQIHLGCTVDLTIAGPPFHGTAIVHVWFASFTVRFGDEGNTGVEKINLEDFCQLLLGQTGSSDTKGYHSITLESGRDDSSAKQPDKDGSLGTVRAGALIFRVQSIFAISTLTMKSAEPVVSSYPIFSKPMQLQQGEAMDSNLLVDIVPDRGSLSKQFRPSLVEEVVPGGLWAPCKFFFTIITMPPIEFHRDHGRLMRYRDYRRRSQRPE
ncbi:hypothetical protein AA313_de0210266 [Arthrobotrys entomopaga]|nr:hypothetical protein AA313_de0210266 [Arthrobotrys entomopaga]